MMKAICKALRPRKKEDYRNQLRQAQVVIDNKDREIAALKRKLAAIHDFTEKALA